MRRGVWVMFLAVGVLMALTSPAAACEVVSERYGSPALGSGDFGSLCFGGDPPADSCVTAAVPEWASEVDVTIIDDSGQATYGTIGQDYNDDGLTDVSTNFCGSYSGFPVQQPPLGVYEVIVFPHAGPGLGNDAFALAPEPCAGIGTTGVIIFTFC